MKKFALIAVALLIIPCVYADIVISQILPSPSDGIEVIEIQNTGNNAVNITGWTIETERSAKDAAITGMILPGERFIISDPGYNASNYEETITLSDKDSGIALRDSENIIIDAVGWGNPDNINEGLYEMRPAENPKKGEALVRITDTNSNKEDFITAIPDFSSGIDAIIEVNSISKNTNSQISDEWTIIPGETRIIEINTSETTVWRNATYVSENNIVKIPLKYTTPPGVYNLVVGNSITEVSIPATPALRTLGVIKASSPANTDAISTIKIENIGNAELNPKAETAKLRNENNEISAKIRIQNVNIGIGETKDVSIIISIPETEEGTYRGRIKILAR